MTRVDQELRATLRRGTVVTVASPGVYSGQPRPAVARCCLEALNTPASIGRILEVTSDPALPVVTLQTVLAAG